MDTHINIRNILGVVLLVLVPSGAQAQVRVEVVKDTKTTEMIVANTAAAMGNETLHSAQTDSIRRRSLDIMSSMLFRQYMNDMDMQQRKDLAPYRQESRLYRKLVLECQRFVTQAAILCEVVKDKNPSPSMANAVLLSEASSSPSLKLEVMDDTLVPRPTCAEIGFCSPLAVVVLVCNV